MDDLDKALASAIQDKITVEDGVIRQVRKQRVDLLFDQLHDIREEQRPGANFRHVGAIPFVLAETWAAECGAAVGSREFAEYVKKKLVSGDYAKLATGKY